MTPRATYRVQFHAGFTFDDALPLVGYWRDLGVSHLYASPIATAREGSTHGYDVIDPTTINPHLGGEPAFKRLAAALRVAGLGVILDIVPNHVAVGGQDNAWWLDLLENGQASAFADWFDIDWTPADARLHGKVLAPFLGLPYAEALASGALKLDVEPALGRLSLLAHEAHRFPLRREDYAEVLGQIGIAALAEIDPAALARRFDGTTTAGRARLHALLERQHWRLAWWRSAGDVINWRRFFDITELAGLRMERADVFDAVHALPLRLFAEGWIDGLRVDHIDGLAEPAAYGRQLRAALDAAVDKRPSPLRQPAYLVVEKILGQGETLSTAWGVDGTTGYEFMNDVCAVLHAPEAAAPLGRAWSALSGRPESFEPEEQIARVETLQNGFAGQLDALADAAWRATADACETRDFGLATWRRAAAALIVAFRVYRTYATAADAPTTDAAGLIEACERARTAAPQDAPALDHLRRWLCGEGLGSAAQRAEIVRRFQQLSAPIAAKAVEDTAFYRYGRLLSRNDVGSDPERLSETPLAFLEQCRRRGEQFPGGMLTTATHDHKRGEDVRARLTVLSEIPEAWIAVSQPWLETAAQAGVDRADGWMLLQTLIGAWPLGLDAADGHGLAAYAERLSAWQTKGLREAKLRSSWAEPNTVYEQLCADAVPRLLSSDDVSALQAFAERIAAPGAAKGLVQTGLRLTLPGMPDLYQGAEYWDLSLVDPDNRRPVDYDQRRLSLASGDQDWRSGARKQQLIRALLDARRAHPALFARGDLRPIALKGRRADAALAFERRGDGVTLRVLALLRTVEACADAPEIAPDWWDDTTIAFSDGEVDAAGCGLHPFTIDLRS